MILSEINESQSRNESTFRLRLFIPFCIGLLILLSTGVVIIFTLHNNNLNDRITRSAQESGKLIQIEYAKEACLMDNLIDHLQEDKNLAEIWQNRDRKQLYNYTIATFNKILSKYDISHFYFHDVNSVCFLRVHQPDRYGDFITRFTMVQAAKSDKVSSGIELGPLGTFTLRTVYPWRIDGELSGYIELGKEINYLKTELTSSLGIELFFFINKKYLNQSDWEEGMNMLGKAGDWGKFPSFVYTGGTMKTLPSNLVEFYSRLEDCHSDEHFTSLINVSNNKKSYRGKPLPLIDAGGRDVGDIFILSNIDAEQATLNKLILVFVSVFGIIGTLLILLFLIYSRHTEKKLKAAYNNLENEIEFHKVAEKNLKATAQEWRTTFDSIADMISIHDRDGRILRANKAFAAAFDKEPADIIGQNCFKLVHGTDVSPEQCPHKQSFNTKLAQTITCFEPHLGIHLEVTTSPIIDEQGQVSATVHIAKNITERKEAEEKIQELARFPSENPNPILRVSKDGIIIYANSAAEKLLSDAETNNSNNKSNLPEKWISIIQQVIDTNAKKEIEYNHENKIYSLTFVPIAKDGYINIYGLDITERIHAKKNLQENEKRIRAIFNTVQAGILIIDAKTKNIVDLNPAAAEMIGESKVNILGKTCHDFVCPAETGQCPITDLSQKVDNSERILITADGSKKPILKTVNELVINGKELLVESFVDLTELKETEKQLKMAKEQSDLANKAKSEFLANMSHEIRTPMNAIKGFCELLSDENLPAKQLYYVNTIRKSGDHLLELINGILDLSKIETGKLEIVKEICSLENVFAGIESMINPMVIEKELEFEIQLKSDLPANIKTDSIRLRQCLINLISNAIKFTEHGHVYLIVSVEYIDNQPCIRFDVEDTGIGIPIDRQEKIFESFTQADGSTSRKYGGTGLGLTITKQISELLGGSLTLSSQEGKGSTFSLLIPTGLDITKQPVLDKKHILTNSINEVELVHNLKLNGKVLVAEDVLTNQFLVKSLLDKIGLSVTIAENGAIALQKAVSEKYDLIFMDIQMPEMDGFEATRKIRKQKIQTPIIALTAHAMKGDNTRCFDVGCNDYLTKPIDRRELYEKICQYLNPKGIIMTEDIITQNHTTEQNQTQAESFIDIDEYLFSWQRLLERFGDEETAIEVVSIFLNDNTERFNQLEQAIEAGDIKQVKFFSHALRGAGGNIGSKALWDIGSKMEHAAVQGDLNQISICYKELKPVFEKLVSFLSTNNWLECAKQTIADSE